MTKKELQTLFKIAKLAEEKGFKTKTVATRFTNDYLLGSKDVIITDICIYLWMCELQKWIYDNYKIHIEILSYIDKSLSAQLIHSKAKYDYDDVTAPYEAFNCKNYEEILIKVLSKALKLIKND